MFRRKQPQSRTFVTDVKNSFRIARQLQQAIGSKKGASDVRNMPILVSESGISHPETIRSLRAAGFRGFLIGEAFMKTDRPGDTLKDFISPIILKSKLPTTNRSRI